jgi:phosphoenolpyruvate-protein kinase (PTS system EI component)
MKERALRGLAASAGVAVGRARLLDSLEPDDTPHRGGKAEAAAALVALDAESDELGDQAERLRADGFEAESDILAANRLMALDPSLRREVEQLTETRTAAAALRAAADRHAALLAALPDPLLASRATDVRELGRRAARKLASDAAPEPDDGTPSILIAHDLGPADVAELRESEQPVVAIALAAGAATSHAAIIARSLGLPMVVGAGDELLAASGRIVVDGDAGVAYVDPDLGREAWAAEQMARLEQERRAFERARALPPVTHDGRWVTLLGNAATAVEIRAVVDAEADGVGLLRTELAFLEASAWPTEEEHVQALAPLLALLPGLVATVRVLDFGSDKTPPFLAGTQERGLTLLLDRPESLSAQLRAILRTAGAAELRILIPLVESVQQLRAVRSLLRAAAAETGWSSELPPLGAMIETPVAARLAHEIALEADFLSIGTNDLVQYTLGLDRSGSVATARSAADPRVLRLVAATVEAANAAGVTVDVCGESASVPELAALYVGLGVDELSVAPARLDELRATVRALSAGQASAVAERALAAVSEDAVLTLARELVSGELGDQRGEVLGGRDGVLA